MKASRLRFVAALVIVLGGLGALLFAGGRVAGCLGPLGVTEIQCAKALGFVPTVGAELPLSLSVVALGVLLLFPIPAGRRRGAAIAAALAAGALAAAFATLWDRTWIGLDSAGRLLSIERPLDLAALAAVAILAATAGALAWGVAAASIRASLEGRS